MLNIGNEPTAGHVRERDGGRWLRVGKRFREINAKIGRTAETNERRIVRFGRSAKVHRPVELQKDSVAFKRNRQRFEAISGKNAAAATDAPSASDAPSAPQTANAAGTAVGTGHDPTILVAAKTLLPPIDAEALGGLAALLPTPFADQFESLTDALKNYDTARNTLFTDLETGNITQTGLTST